MGALGRAFYNTMSSFKITNNERVALLSTMHPLPYFVHEQHVIKLLGFKSKEELDAFVEALQKGGSLQLDGNTLDPIDINTTSADNVLHFHRQRYGYKMKRSSRRTITDSPSIDVVNQEEMYYSFGLFQRESGSLSLKEQVNIIRHVTGQHRSGYNQDEIDRRQSQWPIMCQDGDHGSQQSYYNIELPKVIQKFNEELGIDSWEEGDRSELLKQARGKIVELLQHSHVLATPDNKSVCIISERRRGVRRQSSGGEREEQSPTSKLLPTGESIKKAKEKRRRKKMTTQLGTGVALGGRFEDIAAAAKIDAKVQEMNDLMGFGVIKDLWVSGEEKNRIEVGRREILLLGVHANESRQRINGKIMKFGALPYSIPEYNTMQKVKKPLFNPSRLKQNFSKVCLLISKLFHCFCVVETQTLCFVKLRDEIINLNRTEFILAEERPILEWVHQYTRFNAGEKPFIRQMMRDGMLTPEATACIRHILYTHPKIGWGDWNKLLMETAVLLLGRELTKDEFASLATVRSNIQRLDNLDMEETKNEFEKFLTTKSPCGNDVFFGGGSDATKHDKCNVRNVFMTVMDMGPTEEQQRAAKEDPKGWEQYKLNLALHVASSGKSVDYVQSNIDALLECCPAHLLYRYKMHALDNCNSALKEGRETAAATTARTVPSDETKTHIHEGQHFSESVLGKTVKGEHDMFHHRGVSTFVLCTCKLWAGDSCCLIRHIKQLSKKDI